MARTSRTEVQEGPTIPKPEGLKRLRALEERGRAMLSARPLKEGQEDVWSEACLGLIRSIFGAQSNHQSTFIGQIRLEYSDGSDRGYSAYKEGRDAEAIERRCSVLQSLIEQLEIEIGFAGPTSVVIPADAFWGDLHPLVVNTAKARYDAGHFADAVEASLKEVNALIKEHVRRKTEKELDGASLMQCAFSPGAPIITLDDLTTESGKNIQQGYMQIFAGAMTGIRNPKAHANIEIDAKLARHHLYLASLLVNVFERRV